MFTGLSICSNNRFLLNMEEKDDKWRTICEEIWRVSDGVKNFIYLKDGFWYKIFHNLLGVCLNLFVASRCYWNSTCNQKLGLFNDSRKRLFNVAFVITGQMTEV